MLSSKKRTLTFEKGPVSCKAEGPLLMISPKYLPRAETMTPGSDRAEMKEITLSHHI
jgi:hypothetical protein